MHMWERERSAQLGIEHTAKVAGNQPYDERETAEVVTRILSVDMIRSVKWSVKMYIPYPESSTLNLPDVLKANKLTGAKHGTHKLVRQLHATRTDISSGQ